MRQIRPLLLLGPLLLAGTVLVGACVLAGCGDDQLDGMQVLTERPSSDPPPGPTPKAPAKAAPASPSGDADAGVSHADDATGERDAAAEAQPTRYTCRPGIRKALPKLIRGTWVDAAKPRRVLSITATGISKLPGSGAAGVRSSIAIVRANTLGPGLVSVGCATLVTTAFGKDGDVCRGTIELDRDLLTLALVGHKACAEDLSGVFLRQGHSWASEAKSSFQEPVYETRKTETVEGFNQSETGCTMPASKIQVPANLRGVWYDELAEDGTPRSLLAVDASGLAKSSGPAGDGIVASLLFHKTNTTPAGGITVGCADYSGWSSFENGKTCEGSVALGAGDAGANTLTVQLTGDEGCSKGLSGVWRRWHQTTVVPRPATEHGPEAAAAKGHTKPSPPPEGLPWDATPCDRILDTQWQGVALLETPQAPLTYANWTLSVRADQLRLRPLTADPRPTGIGLGFRVKPGQVRGRACEFEVLQVLPTEGFSGGDTAMGGSPYGVVTRLSVEPTAEGLRLTAHASAQNATPCTGTACDSGGLFPAPLRHRFERSLAALAGALWRPAPAHAPTSTGLTRGYPRGGAPLGRASGAVCERLFDTQWLTPTPTAHGGATLPEGGPTRLLIRRNRLRLSAAPGSARAPETFSHFETDRPETVGKACVFQVRAVARGRRFVAAQDAGFSLVSTPWEAVLAVTITPSEGRLAIRLDRGPLDKLRCLGPSCVTGHYPRPLIRLADAWFRTLEGSDWAPDSSGGAGLDGEPRRAGLRPAQPALGAVSQDPGLPDGATLIQARHIDWPPAEAAKVAIYITSPIPNEVLPTGSLRLRVGVAGFPTSKRPDGRGNHLRVLVDNEVPRDWYDPNERPFSLDGIPPGLHTVRVLAVTPYGEAIRGPKATAHVSFYVGGTHDAALPIDWARPMLWASAPSGTYRGAAADRILVDFVLVNVALGDTGNQVALQIDGGPPIRIRTWAPLWLSHLAPGEHLITTTLMGPDGERLPGAYNGVDRLIRVEP